MKIITLAKNQTVIEDTINDITKISFFSYDSLIAEYMIIKHESPKLVLIDNVWDFSNTTRKHFKTYINEYTCFKYIDRQSFIEQINTNAQIKTIEN